MRKLTGLLLVLVLVGGIAAPTAANHGAAVEGLWLARDSFDGSLMKLEISELSDDSGDFNVVFTDTRATAGCVPAARFVAVSNSATFDDTNGRFVAPFEQNFQCSGRSNANIGGDLELQFCSQFVAVHCPFEVAPNTMVDTILVDDQVIGGGNVWFHVHG